MRPPQEPRSRTGRASCPSVHETLARLLAEGRRVAVATVVGARGSHPREVGAKMLVPDVEGGATHFSIGGGALEAAVVADCRALLAGTGGAAPGVRRYELSETGDRSVGMTCGGSVDLFLEVEEPATRLVVFGAGHVGRATAAAAALAGLAVTVVDDRAEWLDPRAFPPGTALHRCGRDYLRDVPDVPPGACAAVMTRCHETDVEVLAFLATTRPRYVGFMGSRRKVLRAKRILAGRGVDPLWLDEVHAPIGLSIGADTPGEIGIAVAAEIVAHLREGEGRARRGRGTPASTSSSGPVDAVAEAHAGNGR